MARSCDCHCAEERKFGQDYIMVVHERHVGMTQSDAMWYSVVQRGTAVVVLPVVAAGYSPPCHVDFGVRVTTATV